MERSVLIMGFGRESTADRTGCQRNPFNRRGQTIDVLLQSTGRYFRDAHAGSHDKFANCPTGDMLIGGCLDGYLRIYDPNGLLVRTIAPPGQYADVTALLLMNQNIIAGYQQGNVLIWRSDGVLVNSYEICTAADTRVYDLVTDGTLIFILCSQSIAAVHTRTRQINYNFGPYSSFELRAMGIPSMLVALAT